MSDGETDEEALENGKDAFLAGVAARMDMGKKMREAQSQDPEKR